MHCTLHTDEIPTGRILSRLYAQSKNLNNLTKNVQLKRLVTVWFCYYGNIDWNWLTFVTQNFIKTFHFKMELRVTGT